MGDPLLIEAWEHSMLAHRRHAITAFDEAAPRLVSLHRRPTAKTDPRRLPDRETTAILP